MKFFEILTFKSKKMSFFRAPPCIFALLYAALKSAPKSLIYIVCFSIHFTEYPVTSQNCFLQRGNIKELLF